MTQTTSKTNRYPRTTDTVKMKVVSRCPADRCEFEVDAGWFAVAQMKSCAEGWNFGDWLTELLAKETMDWARTMPFPPVPLDNPADA